MEKWMDGKMDIQMKIWIKEKCIDDRWAEG